MMSSITNSYANANQNHTELLLTPVRMAIVKNKTSVGEDVEKREPSRTADGS